MGRPHLPPDPLRPRPGQARGLHPLRDPQRPRPPQTVPAPLLTRRPMTAIVLQGDARHLPLPDASVDLVVTSPPYFGLRSYTDGGEHYPGQLGSEATPAEYVAALVECTAEWVRVLKPSGSMFINLGDKYSDRGHGPNRGNGTGRGPQAVHLAQTRGPMEKSLLGLPWRYALAATDQLGLILRSEIIWAKPNGLPESATDRVRRAHEQVFHLTKSPRYYAAVDEIREPHNPNTHARRRDGQPTPGDIRVQSVRGVTGGPTHLSSALEDRNPLGKLPGSVWPIPSAPLVVPPELGVDHFAAYPCALVRPLVLGWSPPGVCTACGQGRHPVVDSTYTHGQNRFGNRFTDGLAAVGTHGKGRPGSSAAPDLRRHTTITGYACACPTP